MKRRFRLAILVWLASTLAAGVVRADVGGRIGPHAGVALDSDADPYVGLGLRLTAPSSPLTIQPAFAYVFDENQTLYHVSGNVLYEVPRRLRVRAFIGGSFDWF